MESEYMGPTAGLRKSDARCGRARLSLAIAAGKGTMRVSRLARWGGGTSLPGLVAEKLAPDVSGTLSRELPGRSVLITGTNGKTTTSGLVRNILKDAGIKPVGNPSGSNLARGITSCLVEAAGLGGRIKAKVGVLEVDEAALAAVSGRISTRAIAVLNLFRDQLDRHGEIDTLARLIGSSLENAETVYLNSDDALVASLFRYVAEGTKLRYFAVDLADARSRHGTQSTDSDRCPFCGARLQFDSTTFSHLGDYSCTSCAFHRPHPQVTAYVHGFSQDAMTLCLKTSDESAETVTSLVGLHNAYNMAAAAAIALDLGVPLADIARSLAGVSPSFGRGETFAIDDRRIQLFLAKNPTSFNQTIQTIRPATPSPWLVLVNDNPADGRDVSWLWDVGFEELGGPGAQVICAGTRGLDVAVRLKYAGIESNVCLDIRDALEFLLEAIPPGETGYVISTYTAMLEFRRLLSRRTRAKDFWL